MAKRQKARNIGELKASGYRPVSVKEEIRRNLIAALKKKKNIFPGIIGYEDSVLPQVMNALISGQDIIFLGERGQAKSRIMRAMIGLLDAVTPVVKSCEINDDPLLPVCRQCRDTVAAEGDATLIDWLPRKERYGEKLATPDISIADLIGDVDPIKIAEGRYLSDELAIHYGLIPRTNRGILCINELPDLAERLQVGLFNLMEERDIQIRGYRIRLPLDILLVASANPEDYTNRGRIITPLKDRFGAQARTHYPPTIEQEISIMDMEYRQFGEDTVESVMPEYMKEILAEVTHLGRKSADINQRSGVSVRISIANYETVIANAVRRAVALGEKLAVPRITDLPHIHASTGAKIELEGFEDAKEGKIIDDIIKKASLNVYNQHYRQVDMEPLVAQFTEGFSVEVSDMMAAKSYIRNVKEIVGLPEVVKTVCESERPEAVASASEFVLEGLHANKRLNKSVENGKTFYRS